MVAYYEWDSPFTTKEFKHRKLTMEDEMQACAIFVYHFLAICVVTLAGVAYAASRGRCGPIGSHSQVDAWERAQMRGRRWHKGALYGESSTHVCVRV
jgi:hypothetical protein